MRALFLLSSMLVAMPALAETDEEVEETDLEETDSGVADTDGQTASERAGDPGGLACNAAAAGLGLAVPSILGGLLVVGRRRED